MRWAEFAAECPELAGLGEQRLRSRELCMVGTLRRNGWPRISPVEPEFAGDDLMLGMMWRSPKALDLQRDPRVLVHSTLTDRHDLSGDFKLYGHAVSVENAATRAVYRSTIEARIGWAPPEPNYHLFAIDITAAGFVTFESPRYGLAWKPGGELRRWAIAH